MCAKIRSSPVVVFDLDDTLYKEIEFLKSGYREIARWLDSRHFEELYAEMLASYHRGEEVFQEMIRKYNYPFSVSHFLSIYRNHIPDISLTEETRKLFQELDHTGCRTGLITDGRSITQRNKLKALGLENYFDKIVISEEIGRSKPAVENYSVFDIFAGRKYYIADNPEKDFIVPNTRGWETVCLLDNGQNIHKQDFGLPEVYLPKYRIRDIKEIEGLLKVNN